MVANACSISLIPLDRRAWIVFANTDAVPIEIRARWAALLLTPVVAVGVLALVFPAVQTGFAVLSLAASVGLVSMGLTNLLRAAP